uniref:Uncharacterized protein n=1 Tax=Glossina austeni TaxID=7395 RepID=A0A1A9VM14_GLOAU
MKRAFEDVKHLQFPVEKVDICLHLVDIGQRNCIEFFKHLYDTEICSHNEKKCIRYVQKSDLWRYGDDLQGHLYKLLKKASSACRLEPKGEHVKKNKQNVAKILNLCSHFGLVLLCFRK